MLRDVAGIGGGACEHIGLQVNEGVDETVRRSGAHGHRRRSDCGQGLFHRNAADEETDAETDHGHRLSPDALGVVGARHRLPPQGAVACGHADIAGSARRSRCGVDPLDVHHQCACMLPQRWTGPLAVPQLLLLREWEPSQILQRADIVRDGASGFELASIERRTAVQLGELAPQLLLLQGTQFRSTARFHAGPMIESVHRGRPPAALDPSCSARLACSAR